MNNKSTEIDLDALNKKLKANGMFTIDQMMDDEVSGLGPFDTHVGVKSFDDVCEWVDRKRLEYTRMRASQELKAEKSELYEWVLAHNAAFTCISKHLRKVKSSQREEIDALKAERDELVSWKRKYFHMDTFGSYSLNKTRKED